MFHGGTAFSTGGHGGQLGMQTPLTLIASAPLKLARESEFHLHRHRLTVFVAEVTVGFQSQDATVFVPKPLRDSGNVHARLNAARGEKVPQVVVRDASDTQFFAGPSQRLITVRHL